MFTAATWNVYHGTSPEHVAKVAHRLRKARVSLVLGQEFSDPENRAALEAAGYVISFHPRQYVIGYVPAVWEPVAPAKGVRLSPTAYATKGGGEQHSEAIVEYLRHIATGRVVKAMSYHTPAHVQVKDPAPNRLKAAVESARAWARIADRSHGVLLFGGDDNVDETRSYKRRLRAFRDKATGLVQVVAPQATHGRRRIDDFRVRGLRVLDGFTLWGGGDHRVHVRRFEFLEAPRTTTASKVIATARSQVGVHEGRSSGRWNNDTRYADEVPSLEWADGQPWCAVFVAWVALKAGFPQLYPRTASCDVAGKWFKDKGRWSEYPAIGAQVFYGYPHDLNHTGIVVAYDADTVTTVEGNTNNDGSREGDGVYLKRRERRSSSLIGYGYPDFPEGITSADPAWRNRK